MGKRHSREIIEEVISKIRGGKKVSEVSKEYGIKEMTVRSWLVRDAHGGEHLELSRLKRENEALFRIIGQLVFEEEKKNRNRVPRQ